MNSSKYSHHAIALSEYFAQNLFLTRDEICLKALEYKALDDSYRMLHDRHNSWLFEAYLRTVNPSASYEQVIEAIPSFKNNPLGVLEFLVESVMPQIEGYHECERDGIVLSYCSEWSYSCISVSDEPQSPVCTRIKMSDTIHDIAERLRQKIVERQGKAVARDWEEKPGFDAGYAPATSDGELVRLLDF